MKTTIILALSAIAAVTAASQDSKVASKWNQLYDRGRFAKRNTPAGAVADGGSQPNSLLSAIPVVSNLPVASAMNNLPLQSISRSGVLPTSTKSGSGSALKNIGGLGGVQLPQDNGQTLGSGLIPKKRELVDTLIQNVPVVNAGNTGGLTSGGGRFFKKRDPGNIPRFVAGSNGQQIYICPCSQSAYGHAYITGTNQNGDAVSSPVTQLPGPGQCTALSNWWWVGNVTMTWSNSGNAPIGQSNCYVPQRNGNSDWEYCYGN
ncbi:hypothetical protein BGX28_000409 [Mortierella sp. GBA30]|nr:hypothetical protein BGX28_000409 [Mortierella sp. GBA30]